MVSIPFLKDGIGSKGIIPHVVDPCVCVLLSFACAFSFQ